MRAKNVVVTGVTGGVGEAVARKLMDDGSYKVFATCRSKKQVKALESNRLCHHAILADLADEQCGGQLLDALDKLSLPRLHGVVLCAGVTTPKALEFSTDEEIKRMYQINLFSNISIIRKTIPLLRKSKGRIVWVGSTAGSVVMPLLGAYSGSKHAVEATVDTLRQELDPWKIPVSLVIPAAIKTPMSENLAAEALEAGRELEGPLASKYESLYRIHSKLIGAGAKVGVTPERVAEDIYRALTERSPKTRYFCGIQPTLLSKVIANLPDRMQDKLYTNDLVDH